MAREYARIRMSVNEDEDIENLSADAQWLYFRVLIPEPTLNYAGVADWRPRRQFGKARDMTLDRYLAAAAELEANRYILVDPETEEVLVRSYIRSDELLRNPKMAASVVKAYRAVASRTLRAAIVTEVQRVHQECPGLSSWKHKDTREDLERLLARPGLDAVGYTLQIANPQTVQNTKRIGNPDSVQIGNPNPVENTDASTSLDHQSDHQSQSVRIPSTSTMHHAPATMSSSVSTEGHQGEPSANPPSPNCSRHQGGTTVPCRACGDARAVRDRWDADERRRQSEAQSAEARQRAELRRAAVEACGHCDDDGRRLDAPGLVCDHTEDQADRTRRGIAAARAALNPKGVPSDA
ncbi:hypothetical protein GS937_01460 [Rhodococcus hoagii]|uniref:Uncharacterized protein n=1 Tax=Rhodococcus hoagii TaxID=43767 RepID=A0A9Q2PGP0_RHOHA|nr:hypothetical protein [Prescottella equi]MBM4489521.1 hypothetical protein [Prescottella equi]MBM4567969.1 hypothetical protein [Prescottella equi]NKT69651.1 hypothetical protein [Prescottella equi]NKU73397.1 hypothetical protein [Prescottella equi]